MRFFNFRKKQQSDTVPPIAEQEYVAARKQRRGVALLIAVVTFTVAGMLAIVLFFGGRWFYRTADLGKIIRPIAGQLKPTSAQQRSGSDEMAVPPSDTGDTDSDTSPDASSTPATPSAPTTPPTSNPTPNTPPVPDNNPLPGNQAAPTSMPDTGPSGVAALALIVILASTGFYQLRLRLKNL